MTIRILFTLVMLTWAVFTTLTGSAAELVVTRYFTGIWDQPRQESQGIVLQIIDQEEDGQKKAVAYWFIYDYSLHPTWYVGIGNVQGNQVLLDLYFSDDVEFMQPASPGNESVQAVGTMNITFQNCNHGQVSYDREGWPVGEFEIVRLTGLYHSQCSGGISDDTPSNAKPVMLDVELGPARDGVSGKGQAKFWERVDRSDFHISAEGLADGTYDIMICDSPDSVGSLVVEGGEGAAQFRSPAAPGKELLNFNPRGCLIELHDSEGAVLTSGDDVLATKGNGNSGGHGMGKMEVMTALDYIGPPQEAEGEASYLEKNNSTEFEVEIKGVPAGNYPLWVGNQLRGEIVVMTDPQDGDDSRLKGKLRFSNPQKAERELLNFDPRGMLIEVYGDADILFEAFFPE